jgi:serine/threonine protein kinase/predicted Zn-dependent protease
MNDAAANAWGDVPEPDQQEPTLGSFGEHEFLMFGQIAEEVKQELDAGREPDIARLIADHPELEQHIRQLIPALHVLHDAGEVLAQPPDALSAEAIFPPNRRLGDYQIQRQIGRGGMGIVYEAEQVSLRRKVAVKVLPVAATWDDHRLQRFQNEAQAVARLHHQNIVPVYTVGCEHGVHYFAMQYLEGQTLADIIAALREPDLRHVCLSGLQPIPTPVDGNALTCPFEPQSDSRPSSDSPEPAIVTHELEATVTTSPAGVWQSRQFYQFVATVGLQAAHGLEHAHQHSVIHRDIKPGNLLVESSGHLWITDFGIARFPGDAAETTTGDVLGTARYMSPEQAKSQNSLVDHRSDIYSLGVTLYELLTLQPAVDGQNVQEILRQIGECEPRRPRRLSRTIPEDLETIVLKAIAKSPLQRYASAQHMADDLQRFLNDEPVLAKRPSWARVGMSFLRRHRRSVLAALASAASVALLLGAIVLFAPRPDPPLVIAHLEADLGAQRMSAGKHADAIVHLSRSLELDPANERTWLDRAESYTQIGNFALAYEDLSQALNLRRDLPTLYRRVCVATKLDRWDKVAADFGELYRVGLTADPTSLDLFVFPRHYLDEQLAARPDAAWLWVAAAVQKTRASDTAGALKDLVHASALAPDAHWVLGQIGWLRLERCEMDEAIAALSRAIRLQQDCAAYWAYRAAARGYIGQFEDALSDAEQAIQLAPHEAVPLQIRGRLRAKTGETEAAIADFQASLELDPNGGTQMWPSFANAIRRRGTTDADRRFAEGFLQRNPDLALARAHWGNVCLYAGQTEEAVEHLLAAGRMAPHDQFVKRKLFEALLALNNLPRAIDILHDFTQRGSGAANWRYLAELNLMAGHADTYRDICQGVLKKKLVPFLGGYVVLTCSETPDFQSYEPFMVKLADGARTQYPHVPMHLACGAVCYRLGDYDAALPCLEHAVSMTQEWHNAFDEYAGTESAYFLAMTQHNLGHHAEARESLTLAHARLAQLNAALDKPYPDMVWKLNRIRQEAESVVNTEITTQQPTQ